MRVLFVSDVYFPRVNGVSTSISTFRTDLAQLGVEVHLVAPAYGAELPAEEGITRVPAVAVPLDPEDRRMRWRLLGRAIEATLNRGVDLVHIHTPFLAHYAALRARRRGVPIAATVHTFFEEYLHHYVPLLPRTLGRWCARRFTLSQCRQVDALIAPSEMMRQTLREYGVSTRIEVLPTGLPATSLRRGDGARFRAKFGIAPQRPTLLYVGRVAHEKNIPFLLDVFVRVRAQRPDALFVIAGEGPALEPLRSHADKLGVSEHVRFIGYLDRTTDLIDCYAAGDAFVFASRTETQGLVLLEAMAQATPVVSIAELGTKSILTAQSGAFVVPEDAAAFADGVHAALALATNDPRRERLRAHAESWASTAMAHKLVDLYRSVLCENALPSPVTPGEPSAPA